MGKYIVLVVIGLAFYGLYRLFKADFYSEEEVEKEGWPMAEGVITGMKTGANGSNLFIEFTVGENTYWGKSAKYVGARKKYEVGEKVTFRYDLVYAGEKAEQIMEKIPLRRVDADIVLCNPKVVRYSEEQTKHAWIWLLLGGMYLAVGIILIISENMQ